MSYSSAIPQISSEEIATQDYLRALAAFNAVLRADPICRQLDSGKKAWGDIMYEDDERNAATAPGISLFDKMVAQQAALPVPAVQEFRSFPAPSGRPQIQRQQRQPQQVQQRQQVPVQQQKPVQKPSQQKKRARNAFADLDEDSE
jgi:hypothetical protein